MALFACCSFYVMTSILGRDHMSVDMSSVLGHDFFFSGCDFFVLASVLIHVACYDVNNRLRLSNFSYHRFLGRDLKSKPRPLCYLADPLFLS